MSNRFGEMAPSVKPSDDLGNSGKRLRAPEQEVHGRLKHASGPTIPTWKGESLPKDIESSLGRGQEREREILQFKIDDAVAIALRDRRLDTDAKRQLMAFARTKEMEILFAEIAPGKSKLATALDQAGLLKLWHWLVEYRTKFFHLKNAGKPHTPSASPMNASVKLPSIFRGYKNNSR